MYICNASKVLETRQKSEIKQIIYCKRGFFEMFPQNVYIENMHYPIWSAHWLTIIYYYNILLSGVFRRIMLQEENAGTASLCNHYIWNKTTEKVYYNVCNIKGDFKNKF